MSAQNSNPDFSTRNAVGSTYQKVYSLNAFGSSSPRWADAVRKTIRNRIVELNFEIKSGQRAGEHRFAT
jgi:hypothetical protein